MSVSRGRGGGRGSAGKRGGARRVRRPAIPLGRLRSRLLAGTAGALLLGAAVAGVLWARCGLSGCPDPGALATYVPGGAPLLLDRDGQVFASLHPLPWEVIPLEELPAVLPQAFVAVEDRRFHRHGGVDWFRVVGAAFRNFGSEGRPEGASTLTMQLARSVFPDRIPRSDRTLRRKLVEARVARSIERRYGKPRILELYLNNLYLGGGAHGVQAAARHYFDRDAAALDLPRAALLAALARAPAHYDPRRFPDRARTRRDLVLTLMEQQARISPEEANDARGRPLEVAQEPPPAAAPTPAPYFVDALRHALEAELGPDAYAPGLRIRTTLDLRAQEAAERALLARLGAIEAGRHGTYRGEAFDPRTPGDRAGTSYLQGAVVVMEVATGDVLALVGGRDYMHSPFNRATSGRRQVGSAFKPFVFAAALESGFPASQPIRDRPFRLVASGTPDWAPRNYDGAYRGTVGMEEALVRSLNVPTARLAMAVGIPAVVRTARRAGIRSPLPETPSLALGTAALSPLELANAYATLAGMGRRVEPRLLVEVADADGTVLYRSPTPRSPGAEAIGGPGGEVSPIGRRAPAGPPDGLDPRVAYLVTGMLEEAVRSGTGWGARAAGYRGPVAGKTGTTQEGTDAWFVGYTPERVAAVWIGLDRPRPFVAGATGGGLAAPVWGEMMAEAESGREQGPGWTRPEGLVEAMVDPGTGSAVAESCPTRPRDREWRLFLQEFVPAEACLELQRDRRVVARLFGSIRGLFGGRDRTDGPREDPLATDGEPGEEPEVLEASPRERGEAAERYLGVPRVPVRES
jgi:penicillin-binding protein 1A